MAQKFTIFLPDGTPLRAGASVKLGLPATLAPAALATRYSTYTLADGVVRFGDGVSGARPPAGSGGHVGGVNYTLGDGSVRIFQPNQSDLAFLMNRAGRVPLEQITQTGPGVLFLDCQGTPALEIDNFLKRLELALGRTGQVIQQLKIKANLMQTPTPAQTSTPGARVVPSQLRTILLSPSPPAHHLLARGPTTPAVPPAGIDRLTQVLEKTFTILNVFPTQLGGAAATASQGGSIAMEEITLAHEGIRVP